MQLDSANFISPSASQPPQRLRRPQLALQVPLQRLQRKPPQIRPSPPRPLFPRKCRHRRPQHPLRQLPRVRRQRIRSRPAMHTAEQAIPIALEPNLALPAIPRRRPCSAQRPAADPSAASSKVKNRSAPSTADNSDSTAVVCSSTLTSSRNTVSCGSCSGSTSSSNSAKKLSTAIRTWSTGAASGERKISS